MLIFLVAIVAIMSALAVGPFRIPAAAFSLIPQEDFRLVAFLACALIGFFLLRPRRHKESMNLDAGATIEDAGTPAAQTDYSDPLRWMFLPSSNVIKANLPTATEQETDLCKFVRVVALHKPTHESWREKKGAYPYGWHLKGRKRIWEIRLQMQFKVLPQGRLYFGLELSKYVPLSQTSRQMQGVLVRALRGCVGNDLYHSPGDDPATVEGEAEPPTFVMPLWAFDQFAVNDPGQEPALCSDLTGVGYKRTEGVKSYINDVSEMVNNLRTDKVYTFCFWGVSQFLDCINWEVKGLSPWGVDFNRFAGAAPVYVGMYERPDEEHSKEARHLLSQKRYFFRVAMWSEYKPPPREELEKMVGKQAFAEEEELSIQKSSRTPGTKQKLNIFACCTARERADRDKLMGA